MDQYYPDGDKKNNLTVYGYVASELLVAVLKQCGGRSDPRQRD